MVAPSESTPAVTGAAPPRELSRITQAKLMIAGLAGSSIEWYDFFLYGTAAALVFPQVFFPNSSPVMGTLLSFSTFWAGFIARPIGGVVAGHFGDKYGRKPTLVVCMTLMGVGTFLIGCLPSAAQIGVAAPLLLVALRFIQGIACGGQWGGVTLLLTESASPKKRGAAGTFGQMGVPMGLMLGNIAFLATGWMNDGDFISWGWRIPFFASALLFPVVYFIHTRVEDTPEFKDLQAVADANTVHEQQAPLAEAIRKHWRIIVLGSLLLAASNSLFYVCVSGLLSYGTGNLGIERNSLLLVILVASALSLPAMYLSGAASDRYGRRPVIIFGAAAVIIWAYPFFALVNTGNLWLVFIAVTVGLAFEHLSFGAVAAYLSELFAPRVRYSGASLSYQLAAITISGGTPFVMTALIANTGTTLWVSAMVVLTGLLTGGAAYLLKETNPRRVRENPNAVPGTHLYE
jgi:MFS family permease